MDTGTFILALLPPSLAIVVEFFNPISERVLRKSALSYLERFQSQVRAPAPMTGLPMNAPPQTDRQSYDALVDSVAKASTAAVEVGGVAPTFVASITSGFAVLHELASPLWLTISYIITFLILILFLLRLLLGHDFYQISITNPKVLKKYPFVLSYEKTVSAVIYSANLLLIVTAMGVYFFTACPVAAQSEKSVPCEASHGSGEAEGTDMLKIWTCAQYRSIFN